MEVKPGYKATEVGVVPEAWKTVPLRDLVDAARGIRYGIVQPGRYDPRGRYMIRGQDYSEAKGWAESSEIFRVSAGIEERYRNARVKTGDLLMTIVGYCGHVEQVPPWLDGANLTQTTARVAIDPDRADIEFCKYMLQSIVGQRQVAGFLKSAAQPGLNCGDVERFLLALPTSRAEQRAIAAALSDVDALLGGLDRLIAKKRDLKQAAMQQLLTGQTRLPGFHGEWEFKPAREVGMFRGGNGFPLDAQGETSGAYPFFKVSDMNNAGNETFMTTANHWISERIRKRLAATAFPAHSIVFAKVGAAIFLERKKIIAQPSCIDNNMVAFVLDKSIADVCFVHALLLNRKLGDLVATTALPALNGKQLGAMLLPVPPLPEQSAIAAVLADMDAERSVLEARRDKTRALKQAMMQELLTGRTRLVPARGADV